jgi:hypothetical protein
MTVNGPTTLNRHSLAGVYHEAGNSKVEIPAAICRRRRAEFDEILQLTCNGLKMEVLRWLPVQLPDIWCTDRGPMSTARMSRAGLLVAALIAAAGMGMIPSAAAEPTDAVASDPAMPAPVAVTPMQTADPESPASVACAQFAAALDAASVYYGQFADTFDGSVHPDYSDPLVSDTNSLGRRALRQAASTALAAAGTPGLQSDIAGPIRGWSLDATKLMLKMGLRGGSQTLDVTATELNNDAGAAQLACAAAGTHA